jgi:hypothetical protein
MSERITVTCAEGGSVNGRYVSDIQIAFGDGCGTSGFDTELSALHITFNNTCHKCSRTEVKGSELKPRYSEKGTVRI